MARSLREGSHAVGSGAVSDCAGRFGPWTSKKVRWRDGEKSKGFLNIYIFYIVALCVIFFLQNFLGAGDVNFVMLP